MAKIVIPRGVFKVKWKNKDGSITERYRIRISRKGVWLDEYHDTLEEVKTRLAHVESPEYRSQFLAEQKAKKLDQFSPTLEALFTEYFEQFSTLKSPKTTALEASYFLTGEAQERRTPKKQMSQQNATRKGVFPETLIMERAPTGLSSQHADMRMVMRVAAEREGKLIRFGSLRIHRTTTQHIEQYIFARQHAGVKSSTIRRELSSLGAFFGAATALVFTDPETVPANPVRGINKKLLLGAEPSIRQRRLSEDEEARLMDTLAKRRAPRIPLMVMFAFITGLRRSELLGIQWKHIDAKARTIEIPPTNTKNKQPHYVPITEQVSAVLESFKAARPPKDGTAFLVGYTSDGWKSNWRRVLEAAKLEDFHFHDLRHEFISRLAEQGMGLYQIRAMSRSKHTAHLTKKIEPVRKKQAAQRLATGSLMSDADYQSVMNHQTPRMTGGYANISPVTLMHNQESQAMVERIAELEKQLADLKLAKLKITQAQPKRKTPDLAGS